MIRYIFLTLALILISLLEGTFLPLMATTPPNLLLVVTLALLFAGRKNEAYFSALIGGLLQDITTLTPLGLSSLYLLLTTGLVGLVERRVGSAKYKILAYTFAASAVIRILGAGLEIGRLRPQLFYGSLADALLILIFAPAVLLLLQSLGGKRDLKIER